MHTSNAILHVLILSSCDDFIHSKLLDVLVGF
uniref:Uncharacterized protein n=1 Tax=Arundo donax TaxID=35708 RepID=A0A0A8Y5S7_ARUDO